MESKDHNPNWRMYERLIASLYSSHASDTVTVIPNAELTGAISGIRRQVDLLIDARLEDDVNRRVIVDAKCWGRRIDITDVEAFESMMRDCRANRGVLVCPLGFTSGAQRRAEQNIALRLVGLEDLEKMDLTVWERCRGVCSGQKSRRIRKGWVLYDQPYGLAVGDNPVSVVVVGKCDECTNFHIWCWSCGAKFALADEAEHHCGCSWFWLTAIEEESEENGSLLRAVHLLLVNAVPPIVLPVDRRPLS